MLYDSTLNAVHYENKEAAGDISQNKDTSDKQMHGSSNKLGKGLAKSTTIIGCNFSPVK